ncbi:MAG: hypothetical protein HC805_00965 [Alkalinema sp. RL_2_19]|nr:hypothetical protein [Alkalinema sp. RL_2_19]
MAKFTVNLPEGINEALQRWADSEGRPKANLAAFLLELAVRNKYPDEFPSKIKHPQ